MPRFPRGFLRFTRRVHNLMHRQPTGQAQQARQRAVKVCSAPCKLDRLKLEFSARVRTH